MYSRFFLAQNMPLGGDYTQQLAWSVTINAMGSIHQYFCKFVCKCMCDQKKLISPDLWNTTFFVSTYACWWIPINCKLKVRAQILWLA